MFEKYFIMIPYQLALCQNFLENVFYKMNLNNKSIMQSFINGVLMTSVDIKALM
jgi:hypothetical protein